MDTNRPSSLQDLIRAVHRLNPADEATRLAIGAMLGFSLGEPEEAPADTGPAAGQGTSFPPFTSPRRSRSDTGGEPEPGPSSGERLDITVTQTGSPAPRVPEWGSGDAEGMLLPQGNEGLALDPPSIQPLFRPLWERSILSTLFASYERTGPMDVDRVVEALSEGKILASLPRLPVPTLAKGVQVLVDRSPGMLPFQADLQQIVRSIRQLMGGHALQVLRFAGVPLRGAGTGSPFLWTAYEENWIPARGTRVVCVTDLSIGRTPGPELPAGAGEWLTFQEVLHRHDCSLVIVTPYRADRWPTRLRDALDIVHWDEGVQVADIKRLLRA